jgi:hypothetical protein
MPRYRECSRGFLQKWMNGFLSSTQGSMGTDERSHAKKVDVAFPDSEEIDDRIVDASTERRTLGEEFDTHRRRLFVCAPCTAHMMETHMHTCLTAWSGSHASSVLGSHHSACTGSRAFAFDQLDRFGLLCDLAAHVEQLHGISPHVTLLSPRNPRSTAVPNPCPSGFILLRRKIPAGLLLTGSVFRRE